MLSFSDAVEMVKQAADPDKRSKFYGEIYIFLKQ